jgi:hypothetical protein
VDKAGLLNRLKGLPVNQTAEQGLRLARTLTGQKWGGPQTGQFRTFNPVDMHGLIHNRWRFSLPTMVFHDERACLQVADAV